MLKRVKIQGYKSLVDIEVKLQPLSVLFGPNAAGKSNFLDALQLLSRIATSTRLNDAFASSYRGAPLESFAFGSDGIQGLLVQEKASFSIEVDVELTQAVLNYINRILSQSYLDYINWSRRQSQELREAGAEETQGAEQEDENVALTLLRPRPIHQRYLRYGIKIEVLPKKGILTVADEYLVALNDQGNPVGKSLMPPRDFPIIGLDRMEYSPSDCSLLSLAYSTFASYPYVGAMRSELTNWFFFYLEPRERMRMPTPVKEVRHIGLMGEELAAFLNTLQALDEPQFRAVEKALHLLIPSITGIDLSVNDRGNVTLSLMQGQTPIPASVLSEGTLRILGLLALGGAKEPPTLLGFEEPENGIHPDRMDLVATLLKTLTDGGTQVIVTTHSPTLLDLLPEKSLYVFQFEKDKTIVNPFSNWRTRKHKLRAGEISDSEDTPVSELLLRGDLYA